MNSAIKALLFTMFALLCTASCTDDFSRFQFGPKKPVKARDSGTPNMSDATGPDPDGGAAAEAE